MKKIIVLGGVGAMATETTLDLVETSDFDRITVADIDLEKVNHLIEQLGDRRLKAARVNAENNKLRMVLLMTISFSISQGCFI